MTKENIRNWSVNRRAQIQGILVKLQSLIETNFEAIDSSTEEKNRAGYLLGAGFSLWRACFLVEHAKENDFLASANKFVAKILSDNTISFNDDKNGWSCWWYLETARRNLSDATTLERDGFQELLWASDQDQTDRLEALANLSSEKNLTTRWDRLFLLMEFSTDLFQGQLSERSYLKAYT